MVPIRFYNTLTHRTEPFESIEPGEVSMYNCGPTVYDFAHIGNFRAFIFADVLRRFLEVAGYRVEQVMNLTDVGHMTLDSLADGGGEDKMNQAVERLKQYKKQGQVPEGVAVDERDPFAVAEFFAGAFIADAQTLRLKVADEPEHLPRATDHIEDMLRIIERLVDAGHAYVAEDGAVLFSVESFPEYGRLSGNTLDELRGGAGGRVSQTQQSAKRHPADFLLWKPDESHAMKWDSRFGRGYPGWHIECSAMAMRVLGREMIDLHTGGEDNIFPHHECEIAQSCAFTGQDRFARFWMHARFLLAEGEKMSKSKGNFYSVRDLVTRGVDPVVVRFELLKAHYRSNMNFTLRGLSDSASAVRKLRDTAARLEREAGNGVPEVDAEDSAMLRFIEPLADDLNTAGALGGLFEVIADDAIDAGHRLAVLRQADRVLAVLDPSATQRAAGDDDDVKATCRAIEAARANKDYATADALRKELGDAGYDVKNSSAGTVVTRKLATI